MSPIAKQWAGSGARRLSLSLLHSSIMCCRGAHSSVVHAAKQLDVPIQLSCTHVDAGYPTVWSSRVMCTCTYMYTHVFSMQGILLYGPPGSCVHVRTCTHMCSPCRVSYCMVLQGHVHMCVHVHTCVLHAGYPTTEERAPLQHMIDERRSDKERRHLIQPKFLL